MYDPDGNTIAHGVYHPQLITCPVPKAHHGEVPRAVSLQARGFCDQVEPVPSNVLGVVHRPEDIGEHLRQSTRRSIGVCVQAFRFATFDVSTRLIEWLEFIRLLGADKVYFYVYSVNDNLRRVLENYQR